MFDLLIWLRETDSTQEFLRRANLPCGTVVVADRQKRGKGRKGRRWESQEGGLYFSFVLCEEDFREFLQIPLVVGLAVSEFLESLGLRTMVKWPNDVYARGRKLSGVLVEKMRNRIIVGVGLNVNQRSFPGDLSESATSVYMLTGRETDRKDVLLRLLDHLNRLLNIYRSEGFDPLKERLEDRLLFKGEEVLVVNDRTEVGVLEGIDERGFLLLRTADGLKKYSVGEVSLRLSR